MRLFCLLIAMLVPDVAFTQTDQTDKVGRRFEILESKVHGCKQPKRSTCTLVGRGEFLITGIVKGDVETFFEVQTSDKMKGYIPTADSDNIYCTDPKLGMRSAQIEEGCLGKPKSIVRTTSTDFFLETWIYPSKYLFFENDRLKSINETIH